MKLKPFNLVKPFPISSLFSFYFSSQRWSHSPRAVPHSFDVVSGSSAVYRHALKFQRPTVIHWSPHLENTATFIGSVTREPRRVNSKTGKFGVYTLLNVRRSNQLNSSSFGVLLMMWNSVAELAWEHLKPNDFIYVAGCLGSYSKDDARGNRRLHYKLDVKELDFVAQASGYGGFKKLESVEAEAGKKNDQNQLNLWQVFFASPNEWWDQRKRKLNPKQPDFKHKGTGEALWLSKYDPPWVKRQLQLLDSKMAEEGGSLDVKELDFVAQAPGYGGSKKLESVEAEAGKKNYQNRLYLWQVFFASPNEWWDQRKRKLNPKQPDFKHKDTCEALWLSKYDPPWVKRQLQLLDSKMAEGGRSVGHRSRVTTWIYDE